MWINDETKMALQKIRDLTEVKEATLENYLKKNEQKRIAELSSMDDKYAKFARLSYKEIKVIHKDSVVEIELETGRFHQIRVQFAAIGFPLFGDHKYGQIKASSKLLHLFSHKLEFKHPTKDEMMTFQQYPDWF